MGITLKKAVAFDTAAAFCIFCMRLLGQRIIYDDADFLDLLFQFSVNRFSFWCELYIAGIVEQISTVFGGK